MHRDVSSHNLFATVDGVVKVLDFGIAKVQDATVRTSTGSVKGTYAYMAPEQLRGERVDRRTDVFAIGHRAVGAVRAAAPVQARDRLPDVPGDHERSDPGRLRSCGPTCRRRSAQVIARALSRDRETRFPTARALGDALAQAVQSIGGPWTAAAIADEIARAFAVRMRDQQALIRVAREGGVLDLDADLGPAVGHGTSLVTTPVSIISQRGATYVEITPIPGASPARDLAALAAAGEAAAADEPAAEEAAPRAPATPRRAAPSVSTATAHVRLRPSRLPIVLLVLVALGGVGAAAFLYLDRRGPSTAPPAPPPERIAMSVTSVDAPPARPPVDAAVVAAAAPVDAEAAAPPPADAAIAAATTRPDTRPPTRKDPVKPPPPPPPPPPPAGPPGFITIDSTPVYAVIFIDGKRYGETPLVRLSLPPGKHALRAVSPSGASRAMTIVIDAGKVAPTRRIEW